MLRKGKQILLHMTLVSAPVSTLVVRHIALLRVVTHRIMPQCNFHLLNKMFEFFYILRKYRHKICQRELSEK